MCLATCSLFTCLLLLLEFVNRIHAEDNCHQTEIASILYKRMFFHKRFSDNSRVSVPNCTNCTCFLVGHNYLVISGDHVRLPFKPSLKNKDENDDNKTSCDRIPKKTVELNYNVTSITIDSTNIGSIPTGAFVSWSGLEKIQILNNLNLTEIRPGAFKGLESVWKLQITANPRFGFFHEESLIGLSDLRGLILTKNNITHITNISRALSPDYLPHLVYLDVSDNKILTIGKDDFLPLEGGWLYTLIITGTKTEDIHYEAFDPFGDRLVELKLSRLNLNNRRLIELINRTTVANTNVKFISLEQNLFCGFPTTLLATMSSQYTGIELGNNHFGLLKPGSFPVMPKLKYFDLRNSMIDEIPAGVLNSTVFPSLDHLYLGLNAFNRLTTNMVTPTITKLELTKSEDFPNNCCPKELHSKFKIEDGLLKSMPNLTFLDLSGNNMIYVTKETFKDATNLRVLLLQRTYMNFIAPRSFENNYRLYYLDLSFNWFALGHKKIRDFADIFYNLTNLYALDLSHCTIETLNKEMFIHLTNLQYLSLRANSIFKPEPQALVHLPRLKVLDISYNILTSWDEKIFNDQHCLKVLLLIYNNIFSITSAMLEDFFKVIHINLTANPISCDCDLVHNLENIHSKWEGLSFMNNTLCSYPPDSNIQQFFVYHQSSCVLHTRLYIGLSVTLSIIVIVAVVLLYCRYKYDIQYRVLLLRKKLGITNPNKLRGSSASSRYFQYDAFVSYSASDSSFVEKMRMILEKDGSKYRLCVFERDFQPGDNLVDKVLECMEMSMVTILVLTEDFARSEWCRWEMSIAQNRAMTRRFLRDSVILIVKSRVPEELVSPTLRYLMQTRVYLEWHDNSTVRQNIFWEKLKDTLKERIQIQLPEPFLTYNEEATLRKRISHSESVY